MYNNGFVVRNDRFHMEDPCLYILDGWMIPDTEITAFLDKEELEVRTEQLGQLIDEKKGGAETRISIMVPTWTAGAKKLKVYATKAKKNLCFCISVKKMEEKRKGIRCYIEHVDINAKDDRCKIYGWCIAKEKVQIAVADAGRNKINCPVEWLTRRDVTSQYKELDMDPHCGFYIEVSPMPSGKIHLLLKAGEERQVVSVDTNPIAYKRQKAENLVDKGVQYLRYNGVAPFVQKSFQKIAGAKNKPPVYSKWILKHLPSERELRQQSKQVFDYSPRISIVVPLYKTPEKYLAELIQSVQKQSYSNWELVLSDGSGENSPLTGLLQKYEKQDSRIRVLHNGKQLHIAENTNAAIREATGDYIAFADHDDLLTPNALYEIVRALNNDPEIEVLYSDEDKVSVGGRFMQPHMKPDYNPDLLRTVNYICHLFVVKKDMIDKVGLLRPEFDGAQDYDFIFRCVEMTDKIYHIPKILYHWRFFEGSTAENPESKLYAFEAGKRAIEAHYERIGIHAEVLKGEYLGLYRTRYLRSCDPLISILIPNKDHIDDLKRCLDSIERSSYKNVEYIIIENNSEAPETFAFYKELEASDPKAHVVYWDGEFNYSAINNFGETYARGEYLLLLNNDIEAINDTWLEEMLGYCMREDVGIVGARLYYEDDSIQHAGVVIGFGGIAGHCFVQQPRGFTGYCHRIICAQDYSAVTAACMLVKKAVFEEVGGLTEELKVAFNDIDFCMKVRALGKLVVYNPYAELYHYESKSRGLEDTPEKIARFNGEMAIFKSRWPDIMRDGDPYYNPNLTLETQDFSLRRI